jgi:hypothetical protein
MNTERKMQHRNASKAGATCAIAGAALLCVGTYLHPMEANPNEPVAAFTEYAADNFWVSSHLIQLAGVALLMAALLFLTTVLETRRGPGIARVAAGGAIASLALAAALQAVDGIALKNMADAWAAAPASQKGEVFHAAFAVRQIEVGLASMSILSFGLTAMLYGVALIGARIYPTWLAALAMASGIPMIVSGVVMAYSGFSGLSMAINMPASAILLVWMLTLGVFMWRQNGVSLDDETSV